MIGIVRFIFSSCFSPPITVTTIINSICISKAKCVSESVCKIKCYTLAVNLWRYAAVSSCAIIAMNLSLLYRFRSEKSMYCIYV